MTTRGVHALVGITGRYVTIAHVMMAERALDYFSKVIVMPCAQHRVDKRINVSSWDRWRMTYEAYRELKERYPTRIVISNLIVFEDRDDITTLAQIKLLNRHLREKPRRIVVCVGVDNVRPLGSNPNVSQVEHHWKDGVELWNSYDWAIFSRPGYPHPSEIRLPPHSTIVDCDMPDASSTEVEELIMTGKPWEHLVPPAEALYIKEHMLPRLFLKEKN